MKLAPATFESAVYVVIQFASLFVIFLDVSLIPQTIYSVIGTALFLSLGIWAVFIMKFNFNIAPDIHKNAELVIRGPYKLIRHPMYTSVLGISLCYVIDNFSPFKLVMFAVLSLDLLLKLNYEEKILFKRFVEYNNYTKKTKRIIPFIF